MSTLEPPTKTQELEITPAQKVKKSTNTVTLQRLYQAINSLKWKPNDLKVPQCCFNLRSKSGNDFKNTVVDVLLAQHILNVNQIFNPVGKNISIDALINGEDGDKNGNLLSVMSGED